jgi:hypothetical protein
VTPSRTVLVPPGRIPRWFDNFQERHGDTVLDVRDSRLCARAADGALAEAALPLGRPYDGPPDVAAFTGAIEIPVDWGILLVRKGGFAVATVHGDKITASKIGQRHVQGRTKAGGQSQQRFARRRDNQARQAYEAAAGHAHRLLVLEAAAPIRALVCGGDRSAVDAVLTDPRLRALSDVRTEPWLAVPDPRRAVLDQAAIDGGSVRIRLTDPG